MATTTMGNRNDSVSSRTMIYWAIAAIVVIGAIVFYAMRTRTIDSTVPATTAPATTSSTTDMNGTTNMNGAAANPDGSTGLSNTNTGSAPAANMGTSSETTGSTTNGTSGTSGR